MCRPSLDSTFLVRMVLVLGALFWCVACGDDDGGADAGVGDGGVADSGAWLSRLLTTGE